MGTDKDDLARVVATRAEKDLKHITVLYYKKNSFIKMALGSKLMDSVQYLTEKYHRVVKG